MGSTASFADEAASKSPFHVQGATERPGPTPASTRARISVRAFASWRSQGVAAAFPAWLGASGLGRSTKMRKGTAGAGYRACAQMSAKTLGGPEALVEAW